MEYLYKVTFVIKTTRYSDFLNGDVFCGQHFTGAFNTIIIQIIDRGSVCDTSEVTTEIFWIHTGDFGKGFQGNVVMVIFGNVQ